MSRLRDFLATPLSQQGVAVQLVVAGVATALIVVLTVPLTGGGGSGGGDRGPLITTEGPAAARGLDPTQHKGERAAEREDAAAMRRVVGDPRAERDRPERQGGALAAARVATARVARRFFWAFARFELGEDSDRVAAGLRATTTREFGHELVRAPAVRVPPGATPGVRARIVRLELVPGERAGRRLVAVEVIATVERGDERMPLSIALRRTDDGWLVAGLGR